MEILSLFELDLCSNNTKAAIPEESRPTLYMKATMTSLGVGTKLVFLGFDNPSMPITEMIGPATTMMSSFFFEVIFFIILPRGFVL